MHIDMDYVVDRLISLLNIPSPSGNTKEAINFVEKEFRALGIASYKTNKGALIATIAGKDQNKEVTLSGHVDTLGAMVKEIKANGRIKFTPIGGYALNTVEGEYVHIESSSGKLYSGTILTTKSSVHVHGQETKDLKRDIENMEIRIDEKVSTKEDVEELGINVGDYIFLDPRTTVTDSGFVKSRHLDDKAGVACLLGIAKYLVDNNLVPNYTTNFYISNYEEVGHGASASIPKKTFEFVPIDMAAPGQGQTSDEYSVTVCAKDSTGPYDLDLKKKLVKLAEENNLNYKIDIYPSYGSDASAALRAGYDIKAGLFGPGIDASHSFERTHKEALENTIKLGIYYLTK